MIRDVLENRAGWVLTGGRSNRMGADKALLEVGGRTLARRAADTIGKCCGTVSLVGDPALYERLGLPVIADTFPGQGPLAGIEAALGATRSDWNFIAACDMPGLECGIIDRLFAMQADAACPQYDDGRLEPLCAVYHKRCHASVHSALEAGIRKVTEALRRLDAEGFAIRYLPVASEAPFANLNTPEEMQKYLNG